MSRKNKLEEEIIPKLVALDLETYKVIPDTDGDLFNFSPLGVSVAVTQEWGEEAVAWHELDYSACSPRLLWSLLGYLSSKVKEGYKIITWNGLGFDFRVLAEESREYQVCIELALSDHHVDMMYDFFLLTGFPVSLGAISEGTGIGGKLITVSGGEISGKSIPKLWANQAYSLVIEYAKRDAQLTLELYEYINVKQEERVSWVTRKGTIGSRTIHEWPSVKEVSHLPLHPKSVWDRDKFTGWIKKYLKEHIEGSTATRTTYDSKNLLSTTGR